MQITRKEFDELTQNLQGVEPSKVGTIMRAALEGGEFDIIRIGSDLQQLGPADVRKWQWDVTPTVSGTHSLTLTVFILDGNSPAPLDEDDSMRPINVTANPSYSLVTWLPNNWEKLIATLVAIIGIIEGYRRLRLKSIDDRSIGRRSAGPG